MRVGQRSLLKTLHVSYLEVKISDFDFKWILLTHSHRIRLFKMNGQDHTVTIEDLSSSHNKTN
jgi:hypothetical protein